MCTLNVSNPLNLTIGSKLIGITNTGCNQGNNFSECKPTIIIPSFLKCITNSSHPYVAGFSLRFAMIA